MTLSETEKALAELRRQQRIYAPGPYVYDKPEPIRPDNAPKKKKLFVWPWDR